MLKFFTSLFSRSPEPTATPEPLNAIIYDCEIIKAIPQENYGLEDIEFCSGWGDFKNMGISCICAYDFYQDQYNIFLQDNLAEFEDLVYSRDEVIGFNSLNFDDLLCGANGMAVATTYDMLAEVRIASGQPPHYVKGVTRGGYSLEALAQANLGYGKSGSGSQAPILWQRGQRGAVIDYCLKDVAIAKKLFERRSRLIDPTNGRRLQLRDINAATLD